MPYFMADADFLLDRLDGILIDFLCLLICVPAAKAIINGETPSLNFQWNDARCRAVCTALQNAMENWDPLKSASLFSLLIRYSTEFRERVCQWQFSADGTGYLAKFIRLVQSRKHPVLRAALFSSLECLLRVDLKIWTRLETYEQAVVKLIGSCLGKPIRSIPFLCRLAACMSLTSILISHKVTVLPLTSWTLFSEEQVSTLIEVASEYPRCEIDFLAYVNIKDSPFSHFPARLSAVTEAFCNEKPLLPIHWMAVASKLLIESPEIILVNGSFVKCLEIESHPRFARHVLKSFLEKTLSSEIAAGLVEHGLFARLCLFRDDESIRMATRIVMFCQNFSDPIYHEIESQLQMLFALRSHDVIDSLLKMSIHLSRECPRMIGSLIENDVLGIADYGLSSGSVLSHRGAADLIGGLCRYVPLPSERGATLIRLLFQQFDAGDTELMCFGFYAIVNILFQSGSVLEPWKAVICEGIPVVIGSFSSSDDQIVEGGLKIVTNLVRQSEIFVGDLIRLQIPDKVVALRRRGGPIGKLAVESLKVFCRHPPLRNALKRMKPNSVRQ
jgi:hypothetical protein